LSDKAGVGLLSCRNVLNSSLEMEFHHHQFYLQNIICFPLVGKLQYFPVSSEGPADTDSARINSLWRAAFLVHQNIAYYRSYWMAMMSHICLVMVILIGQLGILTTLCFY